MATPQELELFYYYGAGGQFRRLVMVESLQEAEAHLKGKRYHSAELYARGGSRPIKTWENEQVLP